ncbi:ROK family transcriptional regulator [Rathayibacter sp. YIM 133350]|uniref:ROK family transcriptional regulator n=1 Tax=Rathayibacter sp. YIM 133350 TaxID=3131992 RepID=UPI00307CD153
MTDRPGTFDGVHRRNLSRVLRLVHMHGPLSRAQLTARTGLNRSTVAALVAELAEQRLVDERPPDPTNKVGRPSPTVAPNAGVVAIAVNPEVDAVTIAAVGLGGRIVERARIDVDHTITPEETARLIATTLAGWRAESLHSARVSGIGLAVPGLVRASDGLVRWAPHLEWTDAPLAGLVESATGLPVRIANDASLGSLAEHLFGAGRDVNDIVYLNGGASGIGGGVIVGGRPVGGSGGYAGEFGQNRPGIANAEDRRAPGGVLEDEVSRLFLLEAVGLSTADEPTLARALFESGDPAVGAELARQRRILATALTNAINVLNPSVVILGGFLATLVQSDPSDFERTVELQAIPAAFEGTSIRIAELGEDRLLIGAAQIAFEALLSDPLT